MPELSPTGFDIVYSTAERRPNLELTSTATDAIVIQLKKALAESEGVKTPAVRELEKKLTHNLALFINSEAQKFLDRPKTMAILSRDGQDGRTLKDDLINEALLIVLNKYDKWDSPEERTAQGKPTTTFLTWVKTVAVNHWTNQYIDKANAGPRKGRAVDIESKAFGEQSGTLLDRLSNPDPGFLAGGEYSMDQQLDLVKQVILGMPVKKENFYVIIVLILEFGLGRDAYDTWKQKDWPGQVKSKLDALIPKLDELDFSKHYLGSELAPVFSCSRANLNKYKQHGIDYLKRAFSKI